LLMQLHHGAYILGEATLGSAMYIRPHWEALYQKIKTQLENAHNKGILLVGTPGIGQRSSTRRISAACAGPAAAQHCRSELGPLCVLRLMCMRRQV
jgi:hypothetical protein